MEFNTITECTCCNIRTYCNEEIIDVDGEQKMLFFCEECYEDIKDIEDYFNK